MSRNPTWSDAWERAKEQIRNEEEQARGDEHMTRSEVVEAIEVIAKDYGADGNLINDRIADAFRKLAEMLR